MTDDDVTELVKAAELDWLSLDEAAWVICHRHVTSMSTEALKPALADLFRRSVLVPGDLGETGFEDWAGTAEEWSRRLDEEFSRLEWPPMGSGFWLRLADA